MITFPGTDRAIAARPRRRLIRLTAVGVTVGVAAAAIVGATGATAAASSPDAQSVGRFLDGSAGGMPIQSLADLVDARAKAAPDTTSRNPLEAKLLGQLDAPVGSALQLPGGGAFNLGVANQLAQAMTDGFSYGAAGAVANTGGADLTDQQGAYPSNATIDLSSDLVGSSSIPALPTSGLPTLPAVPGLPSSGSTSLAALGGVTATIGAVRALAQTKSGGKVLTPQSSLASLKLTLGSPALGAMLQELKSLLSPSVLTGLIGSEANTSALSSLLSGVPGAGGILSGGLPSLPSIPALPIVGALPGAGAGGITGAGGGVTGGAAGGASSTPSVACDLTASEPSTISLDQGAVTIDPATATITIDVGTLLQVALGKDISNLDTSNFDVIAFLVKNLPTILSSGLENVVTGITSSLQTQFTSCVSSLASTLGLPASVTAPLGTLTAALAPGQTTLIGAINSVTAPLVAASGSPLTQLASGLKNVVDIGLNVQSGPSTQPADPTYPFTTKLAATPDQATPVVKNQSLVRAIEIDVLSLSALPAPGASLPGLPTLPTPASPSAGAVLALANAAAGPSAGVDAATATASSSSNPAPGTDLPTGVPAGAAGHLGGGSPALPIVLVLIGLVLAGGGGVTFYRSRGKYSH